MNAQPPIIITRVDLQRLERLLDSLEEYGLAPRRWSRNWRVPRWLAMTKCRRAW